MGRDASEQSKMYQRSGQVATVRQNSFMKTDDFNRLGLR